MLIYSDGTKIKSADMEFLRAGGESDIFKFINEDKVLKLYFEDSLDKDVFRVANKLKDIKLSNFVFPDEMVLRAKSTFEGFNFVGYTMRYINSDSIEGLFTADSEIVHKNMNSLDKQINELSKHKIIINDFIPLNTLYHNEEIYVVDSSLYGYEPKLDPDTVYSINLGKYNSYFRKLFNKALPMCGDSIKSINYLDEVTDGNYLEYVDSNLKDNDNILTLTKRMLKK